jgi:sugar lactone lactonase YvrE
LDGIGNLYIAEGESRRIRRVQLVSGLITTFAGGGRPAEGIGDGGLARNALLGMSLQIAADLAGNVFVADVEHRRVRKVDASQFNYITTVAGGGSTFGENRPATSVSLVPVAVEVDRSGNLFIADVGYPVGIRRVSAGTGLITSVAGADRFLELGDNGPAISAFLYYPRGVAVDSRGNLFIADTDNQRVRVVRGPIP